MNAAANLIACPGIWDINDYNAIKPPRQVRADPSHFGDWILENAEVVNLIKRSYDKRWGFIKHHNLEILSPTGASISPSRVVCLDPNSPFAGKIYNGDSKPLIYAKFVGVLLLSPGHIVLKTLYHALFIETALIVIKGISNNDAKDKIATQVFRSLLDIVRTPVYGIALLVVNVAGIILCPFHPPLLYDIRAVIARLGVELGWGNNFHAISDTSPCMQSGINIMDCKIKPKVNLISQNEQPESTFEGLPKVAEEDGYESSSNEEKHSIINDLGCC